MYISDAYAHVKSNHIEDQVYRHITEEDEDESNED